MGCSLSRKKGQTTLKRFARQILFVLTVHIGGALPQLIFVEEETEVLKEILARVQKCAWYAEKNRQKCKKELASLEYYLKALIAKK